MTPDDLITAITDAPTRELARARLCPCTMARLREVADLLYVDTTTGRKAMTAAILDEARA